MPRKSIANVLEVVVAGQSIAVGTGNGDDGLGKILLLESSSPQVSSGGRLQEHGAEIAE